VLFGASDDDSELDRFGEHLPDVPLVNTNIFFKFVNVVVNQHNIFLFLNWCFHHWFSHFCRFKQKILNSFLLEKLVDVALLGHVAEI
jgi:hypothetical protein